MVLYPAWMPQPVPPGVSEAAVGSTQRVAAHVCPESRSEKARIRSKRELFSDMAQPHLQEVIFIDFCPFVKRLS
jgi:hypothetical protein